MLARLWPVFLLLAQTLPAAIDSPTEARIRAAVDAFPGTVSLYAKNLDTGQTFGIRQDERVPTASTIKLPIMAAVFSAVAQGKVKWDDASVLREAEKVAGSGVLHEFSDGTRLALRDLVRLMIVVSDNTATNLVLDRVPADFVNTEIAALGLRDTRVLRKVLFAGTPSGHSREGRMPEFQRFGLGVSTPREMAALLERIERGEVVSPEASREMLAILRRQQYKHGIGRRLPGGDVASKSGSLNRLRSDVGLVYSRGGRIAIAITVDDMLRTDYSPENAGTVLISDLTGMLVEGLSGRADDLVTPEKVIELQAPIDHPQGIEVAGGRLWVTWVDRKARTGHLGEFDLATGKLLRSVPVHRGERYHPGGLSAEGGSLWLPVAEYKRDGSTVIERRSMKTLEIESEFEVPDHIGCVAAAAGRLYGANWDARRIYTWDRTGRLLGARENPSGTRFQDLKFADGLLVGGGLRVNGGSIDWLDVADLRLIERLRAGKTDRGVAFTNEGMALADGRVYLLPEDSPGRLFVFARPRAQPLRTSPSSVPPFPPSSAPPRASRLPN